MVPPEPPVPAVPVEISPGGQAARKGKRARTRKGSVRARTAELLFMDMDIERKT
jgi:hypothetical protein